MKQYSIYFEDLNLSVDRLWAGIRVGNENWTLKMTQPGVLVVSQEVLTEHFSEIVLFGISKIANSGLVVEPFVLTKTPVA